MSRRECCPHLEDGIDCDCDCCTGECGCDDDYDADELGIDPEAPIRSSVQPDLEELLRRKGRRYPGEIVED